MLRRTLISLCLCLLALMLIGCRTTEEMTNTATNAMTSAQTIVRDSVVWRDSIYIRERHDTVLIDRWHERLRWLVRHDTITVMRDSVQYKVVTVREQVEIVPWWSRLAVWLLLVILILFVGHLLCS